jgi:hypothetical protein
MGPINYFSVDEIKALRVEVDALIQKVEMGGKHETQTLTDLYDLASYQARVALIGAKMWLGKMLEGLDNPFAAELADKAEKPQ